MWKTIEQRERISVPANSYTGSHRGWEILACQRSFRLVFKYLICFTCPNLFQPDKGVYDLRNTMEIGRGMAPEEKYEGAGGKNAEGERGNMPQA